MRVGIVKGAFAPLLRSQLMDILHMRKQYGLQEVWFVLDDVHAINYVHRLKMLKMMIRPYRKLKIVDKKLCSGIDFVQLPYTDVPFSYISCWNDMSNCVKTYMMECGIYIKDIARCLVKTSRWKHVTSMTSCAIDIARSHRINEYEAFLAGMLHDCTKMWDSEYSAYWMRFCAPEKVDEAFAIHHQYTGASFVKRVLKVRNKNVIQAILHHVKGDLNKPLAQIIYLADKLDPSRDYDSSKEIELAKKDLNLAVKLVKEQQEAYLRKEGVIQ